MDWIVLFIVSWILLLVRVDVKTLKYNFWGGIAAVLLQFAVDAQAITHKLYSIENSIYNIKGSSVFFVFGPVFVIGLLISQYCSFNRNINALNVVVLCALYSLEEWLLVTRKDLVYLNWHFLDSIVVNFVAMIVLSWFSLIVLRKKLEEI